MAGQSIEQDICAVLPGGLGKNALDFAARLQVPGMRFWPGQGYWAEQRYWMAEYQGEYACFLLTGGQGQEEAVAPLTVWTGDSGTDWFSNARPEPPFREIAWAHVDYCNNRGGRGRKLFGRGFDRVCVTAMQCHAPAEEDWRCLHRLMALWKQAREE